VIPPTTSELGLSGSDTSETAVDNNGHATGTLVPYQQSNVPAEMSQDWGYDGAGWGVDDSSRPGVNPLEFLYALRRRWILATGLSVGIALTVMAALYVLVPIEHEATLLLRVHALDRGLGSDQRRSTLREADVKRIQHTVMAQAKSLLVIESILRPPEIQELPTMKAEVVDQARFLTDELRVGFVANSEIMSFSLRGENRGDLIKIVNQWYASYLKEIVELEKNEKLTELAELEKLWDSRQKTLRDERRNLRNLGKITGAETVDDFRRMAHLDSIELANLARQRSAAERDKIDAFDAWDVANTLYQIELRSGPDPEQIRRELIGDPDYQALKEQARQAKAYLVAQQSVGLNSPSVQRLHSSWSEAERAVIAYERDFARDWKKRLKNSSLRRGEIAMLQKRARSSEERFKLIDRDYNTLSQQIRDRNMTTVDLEIKQQTVDQLIIEVNEMALQLAQLNLEVKQPPRVKLLTMASVPDTPEVAFKYILVFGAGFLSICLTTAAVGGLEFLKRRISTTDEVSRRIGINLVGTLPVLSGRAVGQVFGVPSQTQLESILGDSIDSIRTALIHGAGSSGHRMVMVTSAWDGEGKTTVASQLAVSLARCGRRTLLVDGDLRNPTLHHLFEMPLEQGLSEVLRGEVDLDNAIRPTPAEGLKLLGAGHCDYASIQALENDNLGQLFDRLRSQYDFVIIDSPPVLAFADPLLMGQYVDGAILSMRLDVSQRPKIEEARDRLKAVGIRLFGGVVNGVRVATSHRAFEQSLPVVASSDSETA